MVVVGRVTLGEPGFRTASRIVAIKEAGRVTFALQFQHAGEPGVWITEEWFPWHAKNFNAIIRGAAKYHHLIDRIIQLGGKEPCTESLSQNITPKTETTKSSVTNKP